MSQQNIPRLNRSPLFLITFLLLLLAIVSTLAVVLIGLDAELEFIGTVGCCLGGMAVLIAFLVRGKVMAGCVILLALLATISAGPPVGFLFLFGFFSGFGGLNSIATWGQPGMEGVGLQTLGQIAIAAVTFACFLSQAWAILRAIKAWRAGL